MNAQMELIEPARVRLDYNGVAIRDKGEMLSLTDMWKAAGSPESQRPSDWASLPQSQGFIDAVAASSNAEISGIWKSKRGNNGGTFAHWQIAIAQPKFLPLQSSYVYATFMQNPRFVIVLLLSLFAQRGHAEMREPMVFYQAATGGNCETCRWVVADGIIESDTAERFLAFLENEGLIGAPGLNVHLNSPGGNLIGGVRLGDAIRQQAANTVVSTANIDQISSDGIRWVSFEPAKQAVCASACVFAFAGGVSRFASQTTPLNEIGFQKVGKLGVHQFYDSKSLQDRGALSATAEDRIADQKIVALLLAFLSDMDVSAELLQLAAETDPWDMNYLTEEELRRTRIDNRMVRSVFLTGYRNGVAVAEIVYGRQDADYRLELYCDDSAIQMKASIGWRGSYDVEAHRRWNLFDNISLGDGGEVILISESFSDRIDGGVSGELLFRFNDKPSHLVSRRDFAFHDNSSRYASNAARDLTFILPGDFDGLHLLPRTCL